MATYDQLNGEISFLSETLNDTEALRIATEHRARQREKAGLDATFLTGVAEELAKTEHRIELALGRAMRKHPLGPWLKQAPGVGEKQGARLLAAIGNPYFNARDNRPRRGPAELWAYTGFHVLSASDQRGTDAHAGHVAGGHPSAGTDHSCIDAHLGNGGAGQPSHPGDHGTHDVHGRRVAGVAPRRRKGQLANWNTQARSRAWLIATSCVKQPEGTRYRDTYVGARAKYEHAVHHTICERCSICLNCGNPMTATKKDHLADHGCDNRRAQYAGPGSPLTAGHQHARALRIVAKEVLKDIYVEARAWHENREET